MKLTAAALLCLGVSSYKLSEENLMLLNAEEMAFVEARKEPCVYLDENDEELQYQMDMFSRTLDERHWTNAKNIAGALAKKSGKAPKLSVHTWELFDNAFSFPRVRRYQFVNENMDMLEHFQDNVNTNISNERNMANFLRVAKSVRAYMNEKYHNGEFDDPGAHDPWEESLLPKTWSQM